ncbi:hypothetical protein BXO88_08265 [Oribacterium sp. C9]|uniref:hypothetical protein n=1 Tax=Oribacterium sp. C9 TaxID=1943579 RepID=UPI00098EE1CB|nr:hypothetical protein [Oribacterium sp. C9]OON86263.1 hypothetical protein BXO88_08265 [Oribacterium sp. C9]
MYKDLVYIAPFIIIFLLSLYLFIQDGKAAKAEGRKRKLGITVLLILSAGMLISIIVLAVLLILLTIAIVQNM